MMSPKNGSVRVRDVMFAPAFLTVVLVRVQCEPTVTRALISAKSVVTLVFTATIIVCALINVYVIRGRETRMMNGCVRRELKIGLFCWRITSNIKTKQILRDKVRYGSISNV